MSATASEARPPQRLRLRLAVLFCLASVVSGLVLLMLAGAIGRQLLPSNASSVSRVAPGVDPAGSAPATTPGAGQPAWPELRRRVAPDAIIFGRPDQTGDLKETTIKVLVLAIAGMTPLSFAGGWFFAGRVLRPVRTMTDRLQQISGRNVHGRDHREPVDLADLARAVLADLDARGLQVSAHLAPAPVLGDPPLVTRLVANLCENAVHHNVAGGRIDVATRRSGRRAVLTVANTGPVVPPEQVDRLFEPFQRLHRVVDDDHHHGLGLSIVRAIVTAHDATVTASARPRGGLEIEVAFTAHRSGTGCRARRSPP